MNSFLFIYAGHLVGFFVLIVWGVFGVEYLMVPKRWRDSPKTLLLKSAKTLAFFSPLILWPAVVLWAALNR